MSKLTEKRKTPGGVNSPSWVTGSVRNDEINARSEIKAFPEKVRVGRKCHTYERFQDKKI